MKAPILSAYAQHLKVFKKGFFTFDESNKTDVVIRKTEGSNPDLLRDFLKETGSGNTAKIMFYSEKNNYASKVGTYIYTPASDCESPEYQKIRTALQQNSLEVQTLKTQIRQKEEAEAEAARQATLSGLKEKIAALEAEKAKHEAITSRCSLIVTQVAENFIASRKPQIVKTLSGFLPPKMQEGVGEIISPPSEEGGTLSGLDAPTQEVLNIFMQLPAEDKPHYLELLKNTIQEQYASK